LSYYKQADNLHEKFKELLDGMSDEKKTLFIDTILYFGQVAKYRCRSNTAFDNFSSQVFRKIAHLDRSDTGLDFPILHVVRIVPPPPPETCDG
jgi:hypothetical protein